MLKRNDRSDLYLKAIATNNAKDPTGLSPSLLAVSGDILLKNGDLDGAEAMYKRLADRYSESMFSDAGPVGLGYVALARKQPEEALKIFENALANNAGMSRYKETTLGKLQALVELDKLDSAEKLAQEIVTDKMFRGETAAKAYLLLGRVYRLQAAKSATISPAVSKELLKPKPTAPTAGLCRLQGIPRYLCGSHLAGRTKPPRKWARSNCATKNLKNLARRTQTPKHPAREKGRGAWSNNSPSMAPSPHITPDRLLACLAAISQIAASGAAEPARVVFQNGRSDPVSRSHVARRQSWS